MDAGFRAGADRMSAPARSVKARCRNRRHRKAARGQSGSAHQSQPPAPPPSKRHQTKKSQQELRTQNSELRTQNSELRTQNSELKISNFKLQTSNFKLQNQQITTTGQHPNQFPAPASIQPATPMPHSDSGTTHTPADTAPDNAYRHLLPTMFPA